MPDLSTNKNVIFVRQSSIGKGLLCLCREGTPWFPKGEQSCAVRMHACCCLVSLLRKNKKRRDTKIVTDASAYKNYIWKKKYGKGLFKYSCSLFLFEKNNMRSKGYRLCIGDHACAEKGYNQALCACIGQSFCPSLCYIYFDLENTKKVRKKVLSEWK